MRQLEVGLAGRSYDVVIGRGALGEIGARLRPLLGRRTVAVVMDETVSALHGARLGEALAAAGLAMRPVVIEPGEASKSFAGLEALCDALLALELDRRDLVIAFGGGVVGDLTGLAAALYMRGVDFVQVPTTLLAQVDSSVGGKTAIDTPRGKNLIGAFHQPRLVLADLALLDTLPARELRCGFAEIFKIALVGDAEFFAWLEANREPVLARAPEALLHAVARAVEMKADIVARDERESGPRALLNLGHTFGHALETETGYGEALAHGEAVALGCALAFRFSADRGLCPASDAGRVGAFISASGLPARLADLAPAKISAAALVHRMRQDKKAKGGRLTLVLARGVGEAFVAADVDEGEVLGFLRSAGAGP